MHFSKRYVHALLLASTLLLAGFEDFKCADSSTGASFGGGSGNSIRVTDEQKISADSGSFNGDLDNGDQFGSAVTDPGDLEADGVRDLAVGAPFDDDDGNDRGASWILFMDDNGRVDQEQKISSDAGSFGGNLDNDDLFGSAVAGIGDLNVDGAFDLAVGAPGSDDGGTDRGAVWVLFLDAAGRVRQEQNIADGAGGFDGDLDNGDRFGSALADIGDVNGDGIRDLAVGAPNDDDGSDNAGAVWILMMQADGRVSSWQKISRDAGGFNGDLNANDHFGAAIAGIGDLDNDGIPDLAVGAPEADEGGTDRGSVWILFLDAAGRVRQEQNIADDTGGFDGNLDNDDRFGSALADIGDVNGDGIRDLAAGAPNDDDGSDNAGAVWVLTMKTDGRVDSGQKISADAGGFDGNLNGGDRFGAAITAAGDLDGDGTPDLVVGAPGDDDGGTDQGAVWVLFMER
ncbi:MAG: integrin alpha [Thiogranum sp.]